ncbi:MAG: ribulose-phosphate 3-epimerase [Burkholderiales bacterium]|jgi:ribulose-phosphate 3-epimerase|nr:ribulose-phosphate 3-epimerase [Burkholderiales bacterium]
MTTKKHIIAPSILSADFARLGEEVANVVKAGADFIHFDVMDNHYVPNLTFGPMICKAIKPYSKNIPIDVHLMVSPVDSLINEFAKAGADIITFHPEASLHVHRSLGLAKDLGLKAGLAINPGTPLSYVEANIDYLDMILLMSVNPGFGGQSFIPSILDKIRQARTLIDKSGRDIILEVDGGIKADNIADVAKAGANAFVMGSAIFGAEDYEQTFSTIRQNLSKVTQL